jgi:hypothetical protein
VEHGTLVIAGPEGECQHDYDALFVLIGARDSSGLLSQLGLKIAFETSGS